MHCKFCQISLSPSSDICQDTNQLLFKLCQGSEEAPCSKPVPVNLSENPCCPLHLQLPPQMYIPEQVLCVPEELETISTDLYLSAAELRPTESLPLEFSDDLDVVGDGMQCPPSPLLADASAALENQLSKNVAEVPLIMCSDEESVRRGLPTQAGRGSFPRQITPLASEPPQELSVQDQLSISIRIRSIL
uniref:Uncharacterized protein n=1 Tax=Micrurus surinamensis TaxID=129470 RepID=A0A2D4NRJ4_MICSU